MLSKAIYFKVAGRWMLDKHACVTSRMHNKYSMTGHEISITPLVRVGKFYDLATVNTIFSVTKICITGDFLKI